MERVTVMKALSSIGLSDVQAVYAGSEGRLWELRMGELRFMCDIAHAGKIIQGLFVARKGS